MFEEDTSPPKPAPAGASRSIVVVLALAIVAVAGGGFYWVNQLTSSLNQQLATLSSQGKTQAAELRVLQDRLHISTTELARLSSTAATVQSKVAQTQQQLSSTQQQTQTLAQQQQQAASELAAVKQDTGNRFGQLNGELGGVKTNVSSNTKKITQTQADLEAAKAQLKNAIGDLGVQSGLIATTRQQLSVLEKAGQRAIFEFHLAKTKQPVRIGAIELQLKKIDTKHERYTMDVYVDDMRIEKKNRNVDEPVQFLVGSNHALEELVVFQMDKKTVTGYLAAPKYPSVATSDANNKS